MQLIRMAPSTVSTTVCLQNTAFITSHIWFCYYSRYSFFLFDFKQLRCLQRRPAIFNIHLRSFELLTVTLLLMTVGMEMVQEIQDFLLYLCLM
jgi:hypothetical protein